MDNKIKIRLLLYGIISAVSYIYLILQSSPGISVTVFMIIQFICIWYVIRNREEVKNNKGILTMIPILILASNYFISANNMWRVTNYIVILALYSIMILIMQNKLNVHKNDFKFIFDIIANIFIPFTNFNIPFKWYNLSHKSGVFEKYNIKRILLGIAISIPCVLFLIIMLSSADMIFSEKVGSMSVWLNNLINFKYIYKIIVGSFVGLYLFGLLYTLFTTSESNKVFQNMNTVNELTPKKQISGDIIVINIMLFSILSVYTIFIIIQFKYLFAGAELPYGLNYSEYARRGFFELVFLSVLNVGLILITVFIFKKEIYNEKNKCSQITKIFLMYLCLLTTILLISSFYRMMLYDNEFGFTRLRIIVYLFLIFEAAGLIATFKFIIKPDFNVIALYALIALIYYLTLNVIQIDYIIAKRNIDMYFAKETESIDINYLMHLSVDAAPQIMRLLDSDVEIIAKNQARMYFENINLNYNKIETNWQDYNLSINKAKLLINDNLKKLQFK